MKKVSYIFTLVLILSVGLSSMLQAQDQPKKKWSPVAKGAVIGAGTGAAAGAIIHKKNRVAGAVVGGVVGGAVGAGVGKVVQNKQEKKAAEERQRMEQLNQVASNNSDYNSGSARTYRSTSKRSYAAKKSTAKVAAPAEEVAAVQPAYMQMGWILNDGEGDPTVAYANSEYKRKSW
jgi:phage tail tape-measure protein